MRDWAGGRVSVRAAMPVEMVAGGRGSVRAVMPVGKALRHPVGRRDPSLPPCPWKWLREGA
ncbi:MAG: hypothetical protein J6866_01705, partial [Victivallales bacterium]|nr:hypothetical protein [Victivallales bacterium]